MVFSSMVFLCVFLPITFLMHLILPGMALKNTWLVLASLVFYAYGEPVYVLLLLLTVCMNYFGAIAVERFPNGKKAILVLVAAANLLILVIFKYTGFLVQSFDSVTGMQIPVPEIRLPIGVSFYIFQALSYFIDVYRGNCKAQKNPGKVLLYVSFFPQLIAGPIVKYHDVELEINSRVQTSDGISRGIRRFCAGLCKKVLIANTMGLAADHLFGADVRVNAAVAWVGAISYLFQIYFDFSGYSDMAIGLGWMFGFHFQENFRYPYISKSIQEFWRRWHISLSSWFKEYLYIPLGGNRKGKTRTVLNKMIVFLATGVWHGAAWTYILWGIYHGAFQMLEEYVPVLRKEGGKIRSAFQHIYAMLIVCVGFVIFRAESVAQAGKWIASMFTGFFYDAASMSLVMQQLTPVYLVTLLAAVIGAAPAKEKMEKLKFYQPVSYILSLGGFLLCILSLSSGTYNPFIYFQF